MEGKNIVKGYKVFDKDFTCYGDFQYEVGKTYTMDGAPICCKRGFHFCLKLVDCFKHYDFDPENKVAEVEAFGDVDYYKDGTKACTNGIRIVRELTWYEVLDLANTGKSCTGLNNSGDYNSGHRNSGNRNSGNNNSGHGNSGDRNKGSYNSGFRNRGNWNSGECNSGDCNSGDSNSGDYNSGIRNSGDGNNGNWNSGNRNSGDNNSGHGNIGNYNSGCRNSGSWNSGYSNSGHYNSGDCNSGHRNIGNYNSGDFNTTNGSSGCFNTEGEMIRMFNKPSNWTYGDWLDSKARRIISSAPSPISWITMSNMTAEEKELHPDYETTLGYLKKADNKNAVTNWWNELSKDHRNEIKSLPNFDFEIFCKCVGIDKEKAVF